MGVSFVQGGLDATKSEVDGFLGQTFGGQREAEYFTLSEPVRERFTGFVGIPPMQYLQKWRLQMAASKLAEGTASIAAIAAEIGYESEAAFSRAFKKMIGEPPAEWRSNRIAQLSAS